MSWDTNEARKNLALGCYDGYIWGAAKKLMPKLPLPHPEWEDLKQEFVGYTLEAIEMFNPGKGAAFETFLYRHLNIRSMQLFNVSWFAKNQPSGKWIIPFSAFSDEAGRDRERSSFDPTSERAVQELNCQLDELRENLSPRNRQLFDYFSDYIGWEDQRGRTQLTNAFESAYYGSKVSDATGLDTREVVSFVQELRSKARKFVEV